MNGGRNFEEIAINSKLQVLQNDFPTPSKIIEWPTHNITDDQVDTYTAQFINKSRLDVLKFTVWMTVKGYVGFEGEITAVGDHVFVLPGAPTPFLLRSRVVSFARRLFFSSRHDGRRNSVDLRKEATVPAKYQDQIKP
jgi:hypothetical protein